MSANKKIVIFQFSISAPDKGSRKFSFMPKHFGHFGKILRLKNNWAV
jgi:hypothetical protein